MKLILAQVWTQPDRRLLRPPYNKARRVGRSATALIPDFTFGRPHIYLPQTRFPFSCTMSTTTTSTSGSFGSELKRSAKAYPTDERVLLRLFARPEQVEFIKSQTGIQDEDELKAHVLSIQKEAYEVSMLEQMGGSKK